MRFSDICAWPLTGGAGTFEIAKSSLLRNPAALNATPQFTQFSAQRSRVMLASNPVLHNGQTTRVINTIPHPGLAEAKKTRLRNRHSGHISTGQKRRSEVKAQGLPLQILSCRKRP